MKLRCEVSGEEFEVLEHDRGLLEKLSPSFDGKRFDLAPSKLCPAERKRRRLAFRNERNLYHRVCDLTGERIVSAFSPDKPYPVYSKEAWWSDRWDARSYGRDFDFSRPFFEQFAELKKEVPQVALITSPDADENNCPYINFAGNSRNCHMTFDSDFNEDSYHSNVLKHSRNCLDCSYVRSSELCYECIDCSDCYSLKFSQDCTNCNNSFFLHSCIGCSECFMCANLMHKKYYFQNKPYPKDEYFKRIRAFDLSAHTCVSRLRNDFEQFQLAYPKKYARILKAENSIGDYILNAKNCFHCFNVSDGEDLRYCDSLYAAKDCMDVSSFGEHIECVYNSGTIGINCFNILMSYVAVLNCDHLIYCDNCRQSENCFGGCSLRRNRFCILNKQYSESEYEALVPKIIEHMQKTGEWGEYFPISMSPFGYNETMAAEYFPLSQTEAEQLGAKWSEYKTPAPQVDAIQAEKLPDSSKNLDQSILSQALICERSGKPFRLTKPELAFYKENNIPLPRRHPDQRYRERMLRRNLQKLWNRSCAKTGKPIWTTYAPDRPELVYSEKAFAEALI